MLVSKGLFGKDLRKHNCSSAVERTEQKWGVAQSKERTTERTSQQEKKQNRRVRSGDRKCLKCTGVTCEIPQKSGPRCEESKSII